MRVHVSVNKYIYICKSILANIMVCEFVVRDDFVKVYFYGVPSIVSYLMSNPL